MELDAEIGSCEEGGTPLGTDEYDQDGGPSEFSESESEYEMPLNEEQFKQEMRVLTSQGLSEQDALRRMGYLAPPRTIPLIPGSRVMSDMWERHDDPPHAVSEERLTSTPALSKCVLIRTADRVLSGVRFPTEQIIQSCQTSTIQEHSTSRSFAEY